MMEPSTLLGRSASRGNVFMNPFNTRSNGHVLILGTSGYGKTYAIQSILNGLALFPCQILILDVTGSFSSASAEPAFLENLGSNLNTVNVAKNGCSLNLFAPLMLDPDTPENIPQAADRICNSLRPVLGQAPVQQDILYKHIKWMLASPSVAVPSLEILHTRLKTLFDKEEEELCKKVANKLERFIDNGYFRPPKNDVLFADHNFELLQLQSVPDSTRRILADVILWNLWSKAVSMPNHLPIFIVVDEFQNVILKHDSPLYRILCEGRKFGLNLILATQTLRSKYKLDVENSILQAGTKILFHPPEREIRYIAEMLSFNKKVLPEYCEMLSTLNRGEAIAHGDLFLDDQTPLLRPIKVQIQSIGRRT